MIKKISVIGLGKLGAAMAAAYASKGFEVVGVDINQKAVEALNQGKAPVEETNLQKYITENREKLTATASFGQAIKDTEATFVIVPTPSQEDGSFSVKFAASAAEQIGLALKEKTGYHLIVLTSTVLPGDSRQKLISVLEKASGKKCGTDFGFCYSPEFIALGSVIRDLLNPDFFLVGEFDEKSGNFLQEFYQQINSSAPVKRMSIESAELAKISLNHFLTMKITYANMLGEIAQNIPGVNVDDVVGAIGQDKRIGQHYLKPGLGFGGPCFPRDNRAFAHMAEKLGVEAPFAEKTDRYNRDIANRMTETIKKHAKTGQQIGMLGLSYKPHTAFAEESQAVEITKKLLDLKHPVMVFEPEGYAHAQTLLGESVAYAKALGDMVQCDIIFLSNPGNNLDAIKVVFQNRAVVIIDPWRQFKQNDFNEPVKYVPLGIN